MIPAVYYMLTQSAKLTLILAIAIFVSSVMLAKLFAGDYFLFKASKAVKSMLYGLVVLPLLSISLLSRQGYSNFTDASEAFQLLGYGFRSYALGQIYAFSDFFSYHVGMEASTSYKEDGYSFGYYTFKSIFDTLGGSKVFPPGYYDESYRLGDVLATNIFTIFRSLIHDYGVVGTLVFMFAFGLVVHASYYRLLLARRPWFHGSAFIVFTVFLLMSYLFSIFTARYMFLIGFALFLILVVNEKWRNALRFFVASSAEVPLPR